MNWLNLELKTLRSSEYLGANPDQRATWINLLAFCADHENSGEMKSCSDWGDRKWMQIVGVTLEEVKSECDLWLWSDGVISVNFYPILQEQKVKRNRKNGNKGGRPVANKPSGSPDGSPDGSPHGSADGSVSLKRNSNSNSNGKSNSNSNDKNNDKTTEVAPAPEKISDVSSTEEKTPSVRNQFDALKPGAVKESVRLYINYRKEIKKMFAPSSFKIFMHSIRKEYAELGEDRFVADVNQCIMDGWIKFVLPSERRK